MHVIADFKRNSVGRFDNMYTHTKSAAVVYNKILFYKKPGSESIYLVKNTGTSFQSEPECPFITQKIINIF